MENIIWNIISKYIDISNDLKKTPNCKLMDLGFTSITFIMVVVEIEEEYGIIVADQYLLFDENSTFQIFLDMVNNPDIII